MAIVMVMFFLAIPVLNLLQPVLGMHVHPELAGGQGQVQISRCHPHQWGLYWCEATVTAWAGEGPKPGDQVTILSRRERSGQAEVVRRLEIESHKRGRHSVETQVQVLNPKDDLVLSGPTRLSVYGIFLVGWLLLSVGVARLPGLAIGWYRRRRH